jgi:hypothetical protein
MQVVDLEANPRVFTHQLYFEAFMRMAVDIFPVVRIAYRDYIYQLAVGTPDMPDDLLVQHSLDLGHG